MLTALTVLAAVLVCALAVAGVLLVYGLILAAARPAPPMPFDDHAAIACALLQPDAEPPFPAGWLTDLHTLPTTHEREYPL